jgi:hypothetical protein
MVHLLILKNVTFFTVLARVRHLSLFLTRYIQSRAVILFKTQFTILLSFATSSSGLLRPGFTTKKAT